MTSLPAPYVASLPVSGEDLRLIETNGLFSLRLGEFECDMTTTSRARGYAMLHEEHYAICCGMDIGKAGSGWHRRN